MQLYERGKFELDEPLAVYAPEFAEMQVYAGVDASGQPKYEAPKRPITVRDMLRHTAGFNGDGDDQKRSARIYRAGRSAQLTTNTLPESSRKDRAKCRWPINPARTGCTATPSTCRPTWCRRSPACPSTSIIEAAHLPAARHDHDALHHAARPIRIARSSRRYTRATTTAHSRASRTKRPTSYNGAGVALQARQLRTGVHAR